MSVSREVATDEDLADLGRAVQTEVIETLVDTTKEAEVAPTAPCRVTIDVDAEVVDDYEEGDEDAPTGLVEVFNGP